MIIFMNGRKRAIIVLNKQDKMNKQDKRSKQDKMNKQDKRSKQGKKKQTVQNLILWRQRLYTSSGFMTVFSSTNFPQGPIKPSILLGSSLRSLFRLSSGRFFVNSKTVWPVAKIYNALKNQHDCAIQWNKHLPAWLNSSMNPYPLQLLLLKLWLYKREILWNLKNRRAITHALRKNISR